MILNIFLAYAKSTGSVGIEVGLLLTVFGLVMFAVVCLVSGNIIRCLTCDLLTCVLKRCEGILNV